MNAVDTNVLIYVYDGSSREKRDRARSLLSELSPGILLWQVACEFIAASRKTLEAGSDLNVAWDRLAELRAVFPIATPTEAALDAARSIHTETGAHYWDCMLFAACIEAGVKRLYSEDLPGAPIKGLEIVNPFA
ncbi:MAG: PIN domain-containing protein [Phycisphaerales bacterium JB039]